MYYDVDCDRCGWFGSDSDLDGDGRCPECCSSDVVYDDLDYSE